MKNKKIKDFENPLRHLALMNFSIDTLHLLLISAWIVALIKNQYLEIGYILLATNIFIYFYRLFLTIQEGKLQSEWRRDVENYLINKIYEEFEWMKPNKKDSKR